MKLFDARERANPLTKVFLPTLVTLLLWVTVDSNIAPSSVFISGVLLLFGWASFQRWVHQKDSNFPIFAAICGLHWLYFVVPLFVGDDTVKMYQFMDVVLTDESLERSLLLVVFGLAFLWMGMITGLGKKAVPRTLVDLSDSPFTITWTRLILLSGIALNTVESAPGLLGPGLRQLVTVLQTTVPLVAFAILLRRWFDGDAGRADKGLVVAYVLVRVLVGLASGWLGSVVVVLAVVGVVYLGERRRVPVGLLMCFLATFLFLQAGKEDFRRTYWRTDASADRLDRVTAWIGISWDSWGEALTSADAHLLRERVLRTMSRVSLLPQTANVLDLTPGVVPHQGLHLYSYIGVTLIPRFIWPEKPSINEANQFYQVAYGLTTEENLSSVSIAVGYLTEGYIAWGWTGTALVMFFMGIFYDFFQQTFLSRRRGVLFPAVGSALVFQLMGIEGQLSQYLGGMIQQVIVSALIFLPVVEVRSAVSRSARVVRNQELDRLALQSRSLHG